MKDMFGRPVEVDDLVIFYSGSRLELVRVTRYNPSTGKISVQPVHKETGEKHGYGYSSNYRPSKLMLVRDLDLVRA